LIIINILWVSFKQVKSYKIWIYEFWYYKEKFLIFLNIRGWNVSDAMGLDDTLKRKKKEKTGNKASEWLLMAKQNTKFLMKSHETKLIMLHSQKWMQQHPWD